MKGDKLYNMISRPEVRQTLKTVILSLLFVCPVLAQEHGVRDTLAIGCPIWSSADPGDTVRVPIYLYTDWPVSLVSFTFNYQCDNLEFVGAELNESIICNPGIAGDINVNPLPVLYTYWIYILGLEEWGHFPPIICGAPNRRLFADLLFVVTDSICCYPNLDTISISDQKSTYLSNDDHDYRPVFVACSGEGIAINCPVEVDFEESTIIPEIIAAQNFPNPFNSGTTIEVDIPSTEHLTVTIYDILGRHVRTIVDDFVARGTHQLTWDGNNESGRPASSGIYFARITSGSDNAVRKLVLLR